jgi:hypothetical protein
MRQRFLNAGADTLEVTYIFQLPPSGSMTVITLGGG